MVSWKPLAQSWELGGHSRLRAEQGSQVAWPR